MHSAKSRKKERKNEVFHRHARLTLDLPGVMPWAHFALGGHL